MAINDIIGVYLGNLGGSVEDTTLDDVVVQLKVRTEFLSS